MSTKYKFRNPNGLYFISTAIVYWMDVFTRRQYKDIIIDSLKYCSAEKGMIVYAYVIMSNHIHLIIGKQKDEVSFSDIMRDFKKFTAMNLIKSIRENSQESRKEWLLWMMERAGKKNGNNVNFQFWQQDNHPIELKGKWIDQKLEYIHNNPVEAGWVNVPEEYFYSSARNYAGLESPMPIRSIHDGIEI